MFRYENSICIKICGLFSKWPCQGLDFMFSRAWQFKSLVICVYSLNSLFVGDFSMPCIKPR